MIGVSTQTKLLGTDVTGAFSNVQVVGDFFWFFLKKIKAGSLSLLGYRGQLMQFGKLQFCGFCISETFCSCHFLLLQQEEIRKQVP